MFSAAQIMQGPITAQKIKLRAPDILVRPKVEHFAVLDFFHASQILRAAEDSKEELKLKPVSAARAVCGMLISTEN